jgi:hypothetical protein
MTYARTKQQILKAAGNPAHVTLERVTGDGYWIFIYDDVDGNIYETVSVYTMRLSDMTVDQWVAYVPDLLTQVADWRERQAFLKA